jgi:hypothetical protein
MHERSSFHQHALYLYHWRLGAQVGFKNGTALLLSRFVRE